MDFLECIFIKKIYQNIFPNPKTEQTLLIARTYVFNKDCTNDNEVLSDMTSR